MTDDERFEAWWAHGDAGPKQEAPCYQYSWRSAEAGFNAGIESERARVREIADRIEALPSYTMEPSGWSVVIHDDVLELLKELART